MSNSGKSTAKTIALLLLRLVLTVVFRSSDSKIGHAVGVIRLDGELYTINNQGW